ncbi:unnamed protein product [Linum tenue]|uniref:Uncharacterized protein n=1 Tax=Linum tenue TaxID=586396 RepID=A0AAV0PSM2_9ROSI|nr:unnamed protein product [Linum tenue]CAI0387117.1 unnamed protein product [Linum tenue]CAI0393462.1 unnamed protein product [Linum tenue]CAI0426702.1 unnamed protein product [Linum tenue]CAI0449253.1 unnamed protein product [Linum tenue]
MPWSGVSCWC